MMKNRLFFFTLLYSIVSFAQQRGEIVLNWTDNVKSFLVEEALVLPEFQAQYLDYDANTKQLFFSYSFPVSGPVDQKSLQITNVVYESMASDKLGTLSASSVPSAINASIAASKARDKWMAGIRLSPIIKEGGGYKRIKSFTYSYNAFAGETVTYGVNDFNVISNSVLSSGSWFRFYVTKSGVYKISRGFLQQLGLDVNVDPRNIKIYGNGGRMAPLRNSVDYPADPEENAITFIGEEDGKFDSADYILFYAEGVDNWSQENGSHNNLYADKSYYYVTSQGGPGKRITTMGQPSGAPTLTTAVFDEYQYYEKDLVNIARLGRKWHGDPFNVNNEQEFKFTIPDIEAVAATVKVSAAANAPVQTSMVIKVNGQDLGALRFKVPGEHDAADDGGVTVNVGDNGPVSVSFTPSGNDITVGLTYNNNGAPSANAWLDYVVVQAKRKLQGNGKQFRFQYNDAATNNGVIQYNLSNATGINQVWDITDIYNVGKIQNEGLQSQFSFKSTLGEVRKYITVVSSDYYTPLRDSQTRVANQNIKGTIFNGANGQFQDVDYLIVTSASLNSSAETLANLHRKEGMNVKVVNLENIYAEFSSGKQDIAAIRNLVKYIYLNASSPEKRIKYVNLFGDASFDYKNRIPNNTNVVPIMQGYDPSPSFLNYSTVTTFTSDDFYGLMDPEEGAMLDSGSEGLDVAVGRMLVNDKKQADEMVNKVAEYKASEAYGRWRNDFIVIADDLDGSGSLGFVDTLDDMTNELIAARPFVNVRKIYTDSYVQESSAGGQRYPQAKEELIRAINYGALIVNYLGHGGEDGMAGERIYEKKDADNLTNKHKYPVFITASCEITKFDNPYRPTVGEYTYWNAQGGAIGLISTTRALYITVAENFTPLMVKNLYAYGQDEFPSVAEALRVSKVTMNNKNIRMVCFIGDPALKLAIPKPEIVLTEINDIPVADFTGALNSLAYVKLEGKVVNGSATATNYNGELEVTVFDKNINRQTLDNDHMGKVIPFSTLGETIFRGNASVTNGLFEFGFVVPRDIKIPVAEGRVSLYASRTTKTDDRQGYSTTVKVGGVNPNPEADTTGPKVRLYMNDESFVSGGITNASPIFLAFLEDEHGINTASGIGHDIVGILDGDENNPYIMNDYYEAEKDNYQRGSLRFPFSNLEKGLHTITLKAWDVYNNLVTAEIQFVVVGDEGLTLDKVLNYPNPFVSYTEFWFNHNRPFEPLDVQVQIFTVTGKVVKTINQSVTTDGFLCRDIKWDGKDDFGDRIGKGVYVYKLTVRSTVTNKTAEKYEKLVLL
ncbi:type IX secretion system sortase PorU [Flavobacterium sp. AG291]|uniref:type IX secretion system sortase PorU n=1 Tax=Flavobacterium sp. AG291 TaxID=2184000 RepID=UPI000E2E29BA|nr:type IX secretion system sortase PorU [Flavobacterium sp. AG291]RDI12317.1 putative secreted protein (Por secretion system target) [Flavobacterium sp. AG291]